VKALSLQRDSAIALSVLREAVSRFVGERKWEKFHSPKNIAESICIEASELLEIFQWCTTEESRALSRNPKNAKRVSQELADVIIYCLALANAIQMDMSDAVLSKLRENSRRYPITRCKGTASRSRNHGGRKT
jgi:dCTP diphosphatase